MRMKFDLAELLSREEKKSRPFSLTEYPDLIKHVKYGENGSILIKDINNGEIIL